MATTKATPMLVDFSNVKESSGINKSRIPAGDYAAIIQKVEDAKAKDGIHQFLFYIKIKGHATTVLPYYCKMQENQLWKLRNLFIAAGKTVPKKKVKVDPNQIVGKLIGVTVDDTEYEGKEQSEVSAVFPAADLGDDTAVPSDDTDDDAGDDEPEEAAIDLDDMENETPALEAGSDEEPEEEAEEEPEAEEEAAEEDPYAGLDRTAIKARIKAIQADFKVLKSHSDDDLKAALAKLEAAAAKPKAKPKAAAELTDDDLDDIDIDDI